MAKVSEIIEQYNTEHPGSVSDDLKVAWLKKCEQMIINEILISHEHDLESESRMELHVTGSTLHIKIGGSFESHIDSFGLDTELLVPEPYDDLYLHYLDQRIAFNNNDKARYNMAAAQYNNALLTYQQYFNRTYPTKKTKSALLDHRNI